LLTGKLPRDYLLGFASLVFCYQGGDLKSRRCSDVDWGGDPDEFRSTSGHAFTLSERAMSWSRKV